MWTGSGRDSHGRIMRHMSTKQSVLVQALHLSEAERLEVAEAIYESMEGPGDADAAEAWAAEIQKRLDDIDSGRVKLVPWEEARRQIMGGAGGDASD
jgi:putative addiction module component (TIGR02574 family)